jgi:D-psicose/D-tagatose/L-ribulose 3-epimerase
MKLSYIVLTRLDRFDSTATLERTLATLRECGYEGVEFNITEPPGIDADALERLVRKHGLAVPSFLTGEAYADGLCLCSPHKTVRMRTVERLVGFLDTARRFDAVLVVGLLQGLARDEQDAVVANERIAAALRQVAAAAEEKRVEIVIEPVNHLQVGFNNSVAEVLALIESIGSLAVRPMVDTIHLNIEEASLTAPIEACGRALRHVHLCESNGGRFGTGHVNFRAVRESLERIGYNHFASVKVYRKVAMEEAARSSIEHLRRAGFGEA